MRKVYLIVFFLIGIKNLSAQFYYLHAEYRNDWYLGTYPLNPNYAAIGYDQVTVQAQSSNDQFVLERNTNNNKWYSSGLNYNTIYTAAHGNIGSPDSYLSTLTTTGKYYTHVVEYNSFNSGYSDSRAIVMETSNSPVTINTPTRLGRICGLNNAFTLSIPLSGSKSSEEVFYVRYSVGSNFAGGAATQGVVRVNFQTATSNSGYAFIPLNGTGFPTISVGNTIWYYIFSSTKTGITASMSQNDINLYTLRVNTNGSIGANFNFTYDATANTFYTALPLNGTYYVSTSTNPDLIDGSYTFSSLNTAIYVLNNNGVSGNVVFNIPAGFTETAPVGGYNMQYNTTTCTGLGAVPAGNYSSALQTVTFQKSGSGTNPLLNAYVGTVTMSGSAPATLDGIFSLNGSDYVTIDGIDLFDGNASAPATMEYGYGLFKTSATDGCQNNTIKNCSITLKASNSASGPGQFDDGSKGIILTNATRTALNTSLSISVASGRSDNNTFSGNTIRNCYYGILIRGFADSSPFTYLDQNNTVGGTSSASGNTIQNYGNSAATLNAYGIRALNQNNLLVQYNLIDNTASGGTTHGGGLYGIQTSASSSTTNATISIRNNTITLGQGNNNNIVKSIAVNNNGGSGSITISDNSISSCSFVSGASGDFTAIDNLASATASLTIQNNNISNNTLSTTGNVYGISNVSGITGTITISGNTINSNVISASGSNGFYGISNTGSTAATIIQINSNILSGNSVPTNSTETFNGIINNTSAPHPVSVTIGQNSIKNNTLNGTGDFNGIQNAGVPASLTVSTDTVSGNQKSGANGSLYCIRLSSSTVIANSNQIYSNSIPSTTGTNASSVYGIAMLFGSTPASETYSDNNIYSLSIGGTSTSTTHQIFGIYTNPTSSGVKTISSNIIYNLTHSGSGSALISGIYNSTGASGSSIHKNKIYTLTAEGTNGTIYGINMVTSGSFSIYNNMISNLNAAAASSASNNSVVGLNITNGTTYNIYYNSIYINAYSSGTNFGNSAINFSSTPTIDLRNNIIINTSTPNGTGIAAAYRRSSTTLLSYSATSNNNLFYVGTPSTSKLIFYDGTNSDQTLAAYQARVSTRDNASISDTVTFIDEFNGDLHTSDAFVQNKGQTIAAVTTDFDGQNRKPTCGGTDIGADEEYINSSPAAYNLWTGNTDTKWCQACNWDNESEPTSSDSVVITTASSGKYPLLNTAAAGCGTSNAKGLTISGSGSLTIQTDGDLNIYGYFTNSGTYSHTGGTISFTGSSPQNISSASNLNFYNLTMNGSGGVNMNANATVNNQLALTNGLINVNASNTFAFAVGATYTGGSNSSYVNGTMRQLLNNTAQTFTLPVGASGHFAPIGATTVAGTATSSDYFDANYVSASSGNNGSVNANGHIPAFVYSSYVEYWNFNKNASSIVEAYVTLFFPDPAYSQIFDKGKDILRVVKYVSGVWEDQYNNNANAIDMLPGPPYYTVNNANAITSFDKQLTFGKFTFGTAGPPSAPLPIRLKIFTATRQTGYNKLYWEIGCFTKQLSFEIQRSYNKRDFTPLQSFTASRYGCDLSFNYNDYASAGERIYYRIKMTDEFGNIIYTPVALIVNRSRGFEILGLLPNPAGDVVMLNISTGRAEDLQLVITDVNGKIAATKKIQVAPGSTLVRFDIAPLAKGMYLITGISSEGKLAAQRFIKQ